MSRNLTSSDRVSLIKLASSLPKGDKTRKAILTGLSRTASIYDDPKQTAEHLIKQMEKSERATFDRNAHSSIVRSLVSTINLLMDEGFSFDDDIFRRIDDTDELDSMLAEYSSLYDGDFRHFSPLLGNLQEVWERLAR